MSESAAYRQHISEERERNRRAFPTLTADLDRCRKQFPGFLERVVWAKEGGNEYGSRPPLGEPYYFSGRRK